MTGIFVFDAYGTLFDVHSAAARHKDAIGPAWDRLSQVWRTKHLEYTWVYSAIGRQRTFRELAAASLDVAIASVGGIAPGLREDLLDAYLTLDAYPEVRETLDGLKRRGARTAILSNGDPDMLDAAVGNAGIGGLLDAVLSVEAAGIFKPFFRVYDLVGQRFGCQPGEVLFQSSNRWDAAAAKAYGFRTVWVNRSGAPDEYADLAPDHVFADLRPIVDLAGS
jgi:2-haloacid dehalogenase